MELSRTINSDKRYYLDENTIENAASFLQTMRVFNDAKIDLYNALYDQKYLVSGPLIDHAYPVFLKEKYKTNDYYNAAIYLAASGSISSQKELKKYYSTTITADLKTRDEKIQTIQEALDKKKAVKNSIRIYRKDGRWVTPYPRCQLKVKGLTIVLFNKTIVKLDEYERSVEADIRKLKTRLALVTEARRRKEKKLENIKNLPPERIVFGGKKLYSEKDTVGITKSAEDNKTSQKALKEWKQEFFEKRHQSMALPGRHTSKYGNFLCKYDGKDLSVACIDGTTTVFHDFKLPRYNEAFQNNFTCKPEDRQSLCYNFTVKRDRKNRQYIIVSVTMKLQAYENSYYGNGAISMDINYDHFALAEINETGKLLDQKLIRFDLVKKSTGQITNILGTAVKEVFNWCAEKDKRLIVEDIDLTIKLASRKYGNRKGNHHMTLFAYQRIASSIENQSLRREIAFCKIDPAYTSQMGKFLFMRRYGMSIHQAAAYTIGLVGMSLYDKLTPDLRMLNLLKTKEGIVPEFSQETYKTIWARITKIFSGIQKHFFYRKHSV
ncbi:MAG: hypothetical protein V8S84_01135 [Lachnospiraceae bacterium]